MPKYEVTHTVKRPESLTMIVIADNPDAAQGVAEELICLVSYAMYEPGDDVIDNDDYEVVEAPEDAKVSTAASLNDEDEDDECD